MRAVDCQSFAGGFTCGVAQAGFELVGKRERAGGFGAPSVEANRAIVGDDWELQVEEENWEPRAAEFVFGNPPCSGFSQQGQLAWRQSGVPGGADAPINECMRVFARYAGACKPEVAVFESVQMAYTKGRHLMVALRDILEQQSGRRYYLYHVMQDARDIGGVAIRRRYFWTCSQVPLQFPVSYPETVPTFGDVVGDLVAQPLLRGPLPYATPRSAASEWVQREIRPAPPPYGVVDGHFNTSSLNDKRMEWLANNSEWPQGRNDLEQVLSIDESVELPFKMGHKRERVAMGAPELASFAVKRWKWDETCRVLTGAANLVMHPIEPRLITLREAFRIQGFPDAWKLGDLPNQAWLYPGKGIPVQAGRWIANIVRRGIEGVEPDYDTETVVAPELIGEREFLVDTMSTHRRGKTFAAQPLPFVPARRYRPGSKGALIAEFMVQHPGATLAEVAQATSASRGRIMEVRTGRN